MIRVSFRRKNVRNPSPEPGDGPVQGRPSAETSQGRARAHAELLAVGVDLAQVDPDEILDQVRGERALQRELD